MECPRINVYFQGVFERNPFSYSGGTHHLFTDHEFGRMDLEGCLMFLSRCIDDNIEMMYYCPPELQFRQGLRVISNQLQYEEFIEVVTTCGCEVNLYIDHIGVDVESMIADELMAQEPPHASSSSDDDE